MGIYIVTLIFCLTMSMIAYQKTYVSSIQTNDYSGINQRFKSLYVVTAAFLLLVVGLRADEIGIDTQNYKNTFLVMGRQDFSFINSFKWHQEVGYKFSIILFNKLGWSWQAYAVFMAALFVVPIMVLVFKNTDNGFFALTIFIMSGLWIYPMSTMRQAAAIGLTVIAFMFEDRKKNLLCFLFILVASLFHISALLAFAYFMLRKMPFNKRNCRTWLIAGILIVGIGVGPLRSIFLKLISFFGRDYQAVDSTGGLLKEFFFVLTLCIGLVYSTEDERYWKYYKAIYLSAVILPIVRIHPALFRAYAYFSVYEVVFVPLLLSQVKPKVVRVLGYSCYFMVYLYLFFAQSMTSSMKVIPYKFFWMGGSL